MASVKHYCKDCEGGVLVDNIEGVLVNREFNEFQAILCGGATPLGKR